MNKHDPRGFTARFDHVALALHRLTDAWPVLVDALGARYHDRGIAPGYSWTQLMFANGFIVQTLHPETLPVGRPDPATRPDHGGGFVRSFLDRHGPGVHHLTFIVDDLEAAMQAFGDAGITPFTVNLGQADWLGALYSSEDVHGVTVQIAQRSGERMVEQDPPEAFPELGFDHPVASLSRVVHAVHDLDSALELYCGVLGGTVLSSGAALDGNHWVELGWEGPGRLRLLEATHGEIVSYVGTRAGRVRHLYLTFDEPDTIPGAREVSEGRWTVESNEMIGVRLVIASTAR